MTDRVVAVVVAYNRRELLQQTLDALAAQTRAADAVVVVDNASTDGSSGVARRHDLGPEVVRLERNTGGAGGFAAGIAHALEGFAADLVWLMDDDTIPTPTALAQLLRAREEYPGRPALLASRAVWHDGREHPMNTPRERPFVAPELRRRAERAGAVPVRTASFVSLLVDAGAVRREGLPMAAYFIWNDDFEYSARLLRHRVGLYVPASVVEHRTKTFGASDVDPGERFYFEIRNKVWMFAHSRAFGLAGTVLYGGSSVRRWVRTIGRSGERGVLVRAGWRGLRDALAARPAPTTRVLADLPVSAAVELVEDGAARG
ncbi:glycosyltransferase [Georgenia faecalis]|uniref:Glycosyltransferase n=1 Tax=Georgenia faecalis TaxID=2483799 RepID=A0ABV9DB89_9MICO|nr:glycosyltransferase [Georgenia faecalis]